MLDYILVLGESQILEVTNKWLDKMEDEGIVE